MVIVSVDYGDVRTGLAACDKEERLAYPLGVIVQSKAEVLAAQIAEKCKECGAERIVLGLPKNMDGSEGFRAEAVKAFRQILADVSGLEVVLQDERLTTVSAHTYLNMTNTRGKKRKETVDAVSAVLILEDHLARRKRETQ
ncbi:MAG: Holliday junction resolvase RuvX [Clostridia bacterium]|nr:Holliday junction resolvase RuvX [Clostridia bacterium]